MYDCIIVGAGPAGLSAAIYLKNANKNILMLEKEVPGGKILKAKKINNYLGLTNIDPSSIAYSMYEQVINMNVSIKIEKVLDIKQENNFIIKTNKEKYKTKNILLCCGKVEKSLGIENEVELIGNGISYCAKCDGNLFKDKKIVVVGNNKESIEEAMYLKNIASKIIYINYSNEHIKIDNMEVIENKKIKSLYKENDKLSMIKLDDNTEIKTDGLFILNGSTPNIDFIKKLNIKTCNGYIIVDKNMKTNIDGIYAAGDIIKKDLYQIVTAASEGAVAAVNIIKSKER